MRCGYKTTGGFSLVELAVVMMVVSVFFAAALSGATAFVQRSRYAQAKEDIELAKQAILGFVYQNKRLPCADVADDDDNVYFPTVDPSFMPDGVEDLVDEGLDTQACQLVLGLSIGFLPAGTLGVNGIDPWGTPYFYRVDRDFADVAPSDDPGEDPSFEISDIGDILIQDEVPATISQNTPFIIFTTGPNRIVEAGLVDTPALEEENLDGFFNATYTNAPFSSGGANQFDDLVGWMSLNVLKAKLVEADILP